MEIRDKVELYDKVYNVFTHGGLVNDGDLGGERLSIQDLVTNEDIAPWVPKVVKRIIVEAVQPQQLILPNLFTRVDIPQGQMVEIGSLGAVTAGLIAQGDIYPETTLATDTVGATVNITVSKYGCAINISDEAIKDNQFDVITLWLRAAGAALARLKESKAIKLINSMGVTVFDNAAPSNSEIGSTTGRNIAGDFNGTMTINDLFDMWAYMALRGFNPDTIIMNPLAWKMFAVDPQLREIVLNGAVLATRRMPLGSGTEWNGIFTPEGVGPRYKYEGDADGINAYTTNLSPVGATWNIPPRYLPAPMKVLVTHMVPFTEGATQADKPLTNIIMADSQRCGILVQRENPSTKEADIFHRDVHAVHIYERYGMGLFDQGKGIAVARNMVVDRNYIFDNVNTATLADQNQSVIRP